jgi:antitoxin (DNA-binding transcriptional repressor) of toxin-antitoxin stability system
MEVTAKELKQRLGKYLAKAACGETVRVTNRGKVIAEITRPAVTARDKLARLVAQGRATPGSGRGLPPEAVRSPARYSTTDIISADRDDDGR